jgi:hypothetical protein
MALTSKSLQVVQLSCDAIDIATAIPVGVEERSRIDLKMVNRLLGGAVPVTRENVTAPDVRPGETYLVNNGLLPPLLGVVTVVFGHFAPSKRLAVAWTKKKGLPLTYI